VTETIGVAISTTGDEHRMGFLETCVAAWDRALPSGASLFVTVDGDEAACNRVARAVYEWTGSVYRVGAPRWGDHVPPWLDRMGVAVNKNTGLELLMDNTRVEHLFLCDDDTWPLLPQSLTKHIDLDQPHSMVCWGKSRLSPGTHGVGAYAAWNWPRGVMLYTHRVVVEWVGGMDERFGPGGHEHAEWSRRIHQAGLTPAPFISPASYALKGVSGNPATRADALWHAEDMRKPGEMPHQWDARKKRNTTVRTKGRDWAHIDKIMAERDGDTSFVTYTAHENGRSSATLCSSSICDCAKEPEPETPRSDK
jgi:hypothetical protein